MWDVNQIWQSEKFKSMLLYERDNCREKLVYDVNKLLNAYFKMLSSDTRQEASLFLIRNNDPQLLALIFSLISITHNKDDLSAYLGDPKLLEYMSDMIIIEDKKSITSFRTHSMSIPEKNMDIGESFAIPKSSLSVYNVDLHKWEHFIDDWRFEYDNNIVTVDSGIVTAKKPGSTIIHCINKKNGGGIRIKINSGKVRQANIGEFFFTQIRNIIAHGRFVLANSGSYDTLAEYGEYNMYPGDNRYSFGLQRELVLYDKNQLNIVYGSNNSFNPKYLIYLAKTLYLKDQNKFLQFIKTFDEETNAVSFIDLFEGRNPLSEDSPKKFTEDELNDFKALLILSKFYINFIYNYDSFEKKSFNYDTLTIKDEVKGGLDNHQLIYEIRTAIMHGRYTYGDEGFHFWNIDKKTNQKSFDLKIKYDDIINLISQKEELFNNNMTYNPNMEYYMKKNPSFSISLK